MSRLLALLFLTGCTTIGTPPMDGFPKLTVVYHEVSTQAVGDKCNTPLAGLLYYVMGCAEPDFDTMTCHIYMDQNFPDPSLREHERLHCEGWDHVNGRAMRDSWIAWQKAQP